MPWPALTVQDLAILTEVAVKLGFGKHADHFLKAAYDKTDRLPVQIDFNLIQGLCQAALTESAKAILSSHQRKFMVDLNSDL